MKIDIGISKTERIPHKKKQIRVMVLRNIDFNYQLFYSIKSEMIVDKVAELQPGWSVVWWALSSQKVTFQDMLAVKEGSIKI